MTPTSRGSLATEQNHSGNCLLPVFGRHCLESKIAVDNSEDVHALALVFVQSFDLDDGLLSSRFINK